VGGPLGNGAIGAIKISPDGKKLACAKLSFESGLELFDFDTSTGEVSNAKKIHSLSSYGVEFSPNSQFLYATSKGFGSNVYQYNLTESDPEEIFDSRVQISTNDLSNSLQLGINGKLYIAQSASLGLSYEPDDYISVINAPNKLGTACDYEEDAIYLEGKQSTFGLPPFISNWFEYAIEAGDFCWGEA